MDKKNWIQPEMNSINIALGGGPTFDGANSSFRNFS